MERVRWRWEKSLNIFFYKWWPDGTLSVLRKPHVKQISSAHHLFSRNFERGGAYAPEPKLKVNMHKAMDRFPVTHRVIDREMKQLRKPDLDCKLNETTRDENLILLYRCLNWSIILAKWNEADGALRPWSMLSWWAAHEKRRLQNGQGHWFV